jgi:hypothetical protein
MQMLDQQVAAPRLVFQQRAHVGERVVVDDATLRPALTARSW